ncbi:hypothetical protein DENIS_5126 [Desulfonema ishimotonii]|uniref:Uncharacterized protein n=1 Tax=Desulfonema ishimotonii TaxID=45657 RepID=A0A401G4E4_9BACT|nr:hypothetical protein [Desulfonema ishimotonii]GBC64109.1 hypothetical protein DENIS_5126 [Desulfonema ishimotonii]
MGSCFKNPFGVQKLSPRRGRSFAKFAKFQEVATPAHKKELEIWEKAGIKVASDGGQAIIRNYGKGLCGEAMYNDAEYAEKYDH